MINTIAILGAGTMGEGMARIFPGYGWHTILYDPDQNALAVAKNRLLNAEEVEPEAASSNVQVKENLVFTGVLEEAIRKADFIIETAPEDLKIKRQLYSEIGSMLKPDAIVASNTSSYSLAKLCAQQTFANRLIIAHFFNPAHIIPLVEIVKSDDTTPGVAESIAGFLSACGKVPVILKKDINGFIANRLQAAVLREACFLVENGIADAGQIDTVMKESVGMRWAVSGPFQVADYGGLDIWEKVLANLLPLLSNNSEVPVIVSGKVKQNELGLKSGKGFFNYASKNDRQQVEDWKMKLTKILKFRDQK
jgi:3-hydroxybutyryl-CoA dehydrogenase